MYERIFPHFIDAKVHKGKLYLMIEIYGNNYAFETVIKEIQLDIHGGTIELDLLRYKEMQDLLKLMDKDSDSST